MNNVHDKRGGLNMYMDLTSKQCDQSIARTNLYENLRKPEKKTNNCNNTTDYL